MSGCRRTHIKPALTPAGTVTVMLCTGAMPAMPATPEAEEMQMTRMVRACLGLHGPVHIVPILRGEGTV